MVGYESRIPRQIPSRSYGRTFSASDCSDPDGAIDTHGGSVLLASADPMIIAEQTPGRWDSMNRRLVGLSVASSYSNHAERQRSGPNAAKA
jgi:hypothetical protein